MQEQKERLLADKVAEVIAAAGTWVPAREPGREVQRRPVGYLGEHRERVGAEAQLHLCAHWRSVDGRDFRDYTAPASIH